MSNKSITVIAWNNGSYRPTGAGYGIELRAEDRDNYFNRRWKKVFLRLEGKLEDIKVNLSESFWNECPELRSKYIGIWLIRNRKAPWQKGRPPKTIMEFVRGNKFRVNF